MSYDYYLRIVKELRSEIRCIRIQWTVDLVQSLCGWSTLIYVAAEHDEHKVLGVAFGGSILLSLLIKYYFARKYKDGPA